MFMGQPVALLGTSYLLMSLGCPHLHSSSRVHDGTPLIISECDTCQPPGNQHDTRTPYTYCFKQ